MVKIKESIVESNAVFSDDHKHRFLLSRTWDKRKKAASIIMINPSFADEVRIDNSVMKVSNFLVDNEYGRLSIINLFSFISTDPQGLANNNDTTRIETDHYICETLKDTDTIIIAWGSDKNKYVRRKKEIMRLLEKYKSKLVCFKDKDNRKGRHPSRLGNNLELCDFI